MKNRLLAGMICAALAASPALATTPAEWAEMPDKTFGKKLLTTSSMLHIRKIAASKDEMPYPKKVGILSFTLFSPTFGQKGGGRMFSEFLTPSGSMMLADTLYGAALPEMRKHLEDMGMTLLTPDQYLDTDEKRAMYDEAEFEHSKTWKAVGAIQRKVRASLVDDVKAQPDGMKYLFATAADAKVWRVVGKFAGDLDLDAVLVIENTIGFDGKQITLQRIDANLIGPNSAPDRPENKKLYAPMGPLKGYLEGVLYANWGGSAPKGSVLLARLKKGKVTEEYFDGIGAVYGRIVGGLVGEMEAEREKQIGKMKK